MRYLRKYILCLGILSGSESKIGKSEIRSFGASVLADLRLLYRLWRTFLVISN